MEVQLHSFLTSAVFGEEWSASRSGHFTSGENYLFSIEQEGGWIPKSLWILPGRDKSFTPSANRTPSFGLPPSCLIAKIAPNRIPMRKRKSYSIVMSFSTFIFVRESARDARECQWRLCQAVACNKCAIQRRRSARLLAGRAFVTV